MSVDQGGTSVLDRQGLELEEWEIAHDVSVMKQVKTAAVQSATAGHFDAIDRSSITRKTFTVSVWLLAATSQLACCTAAS